MIRRNVSKEAHPAVSLVQCLRRLTRAMAYRDGKSKGLSLGRCFAIQKLQCSGCPACRSLCLPLFNSDLESIEYLPASHSISNASHAKCNQLLQYVTDGFTNCNCNSFTLGACLQAYSGRMQRCGWLVRVVQPCPFETIVEHLSSRDNPPPIAPCIFAEILHRLLRPLHQTANPSPLEPKLPARYSE